MDEGRKDEARDTFGALLQSYQKLIGKEIKSNILSSKNYSVLEVFIHIFLNHLQDILKKGIKKSYINVEENLPFVKGKIIINENIKYNTAHRERFYVQYNEFSENNAENRILKAAIHCLLHKSDNKENIKRLRQVLLYFVDVDSSQNIDFDISQINLSRLHSYYEKPLNMAKIFIKGFCLEPKEGKVELTSLLFPLNNLFEDYVLQAIKDYTVTTQSTEKYLIEKINNHEKQKFQLRPDFIIKKQGKIAIIDAKWKLIDQLAEDGKYSISQADLYQLFAYGKKYQKDGIVKLFLVFPETINFNQKISFEYENGLEILIVPIQVKQDIIVSEEKLLIELDNFFNSD